MPDAWNIQADVVVVGFGAAGACAALEASAALGRARQPRQARRAAACSCSTGSTAAGRLRCRAGWCTRAAGRRSSARPASATRPRRCSATCGPRPATSCRPARSASSARAARPCSAGLRATGCRSREASARTRRRTRPTVTTCTTRAASCPRGISPGPRPEGTGLSAAAPRAGCCSRGWPRPSGGPASRSSRQTAAVRLITENGRVTGVECRSLRGAPLWVRAAHRLTHRAALKPYLYVPKLGRVMHRPADWLEQRYGRTLSSRSRSRRGHRGRRLRGEPADAARARAVRPRRPAVGHAGRRRERHPARHRGRGSGRLPGPGLGLALPHPAARPGARAPGRPRREADLRRVPVRRGHRRSDRPRRRPGVASGGPRHPDRGTAAGARLDALVPAAAGLVPALRRPGHRSRPSPRSRPASASTPTGSRPRWPPTTERPSATG